MISQSSCKTRTTSEILQQRNRWECKHHVNVGSTRAAESSVPNRCQSTMHELGKLSLAFSTILENRITQMYMANSVRKKNGKIKLKHEKWDKRYLIQITVWETTIKRAFEQFTNVHSDVTEREENSNNHAPHSWLQLLSDPKLELYQCRCIYQCHRIQHSTQEEVGIL